MPCEDDLWIFIYVWAESRYLYQNKIENHFTLLRYIYFNSAQSISTYRSFLLNSVQALVLAKRCLSQTKGEISINWVSQVYLDQIKQYTLTSIVY